MNETKIYLLLYSANLAFIITNVYGWILKEFHTARPYRKHFETLFPAQRTVGLLYLAQLLEIPYLLMTGQAKALFYINAFSALFFPSMMVVISEGYFFRRKYKVRQLILYFLPVYTPVGYLLLAALGIIPASPTLYRWMFWVVCLAFLYYIIKVAIVQKKILHKVSTVAEGNNAANDSFPVSLALRTRWLLLPISLSMFGCFLCNDAYIKMARDILYTIVNVWFLFYTIKPHRKIIQANTTNAVVPDNSSKYKLSAERCLELELQIRNKLESEKLFQNPALTIDYLAEQLNSNKSYVSEAIKRSSFGSYYTMINHYRIEHAITMFKENPKQKIEHISAASGFSSTSVFSQVFKRSKGVSPTQFIQDISSKTE